MDEQKMMEQNTQENIALPQKSVGTILREARLAKRLSLEELEKKTNVRSYYLAAVENDEYDKTPGEVFLKGMIRNYGNALGLDGLELVHQYKASVAGKAKDDVRSKGIREAEKVHLNIKLKDPRDIGSGTGKFEMADLPVKQILAGFLGVVLLAGAYFAIPAAYNYLKAPVSVEDSVKTGTPAANEQNSKNVTAQGAVITDKVVVEMEAGGSCWLEVAADGKEAYEGMLQKDDKRTFEAKEKLVVKYGNIGVMKISVNGKLIDLQGEHGVAVKTYTLENSTK